jgi:hypothetical protein
MTPVENLITLAETSLAAGMAELKHVAEERTETLHRIGREHAARRSRLPPDGPRVAPKRTALSATPPTPHEPDAFVAHIATRLRHL